jgi:transposase
MRPLSTAKRNHIVELLRSGTSGKDIHNQTGASLGAISKIRSEYCPEVSKSSGGRPRKLTPADVLYARRIMRMRKAENAVQVAKALKNVTNQSISPETVRRNLREIGMKAVVKRKRPFLKPRHRRERLQWAERCKEFTLEDWKRVIWSDEVKINCLGSDGRTWVYKDVGEELNDRLVKSTVKFGGGNVMMWGCMLWDGVGYATRIEGRMDAELYTSILEDELQQSVEYYDKSPTDMVFQQDNDPKHRSTRATKWLGESGFTIMKWPAQSPDLSPIEHLWSYLKRRLDEYEIPPSSQNELWQRCEEEWEKIPKEVCQNLIESMPRRVAAVLRAKGGHTKY